MSQVNLLFFANGLIANPESILVIRPKFTLTESFSIPDVDLESTSSQIVLATNRTIQIEHTLYWYNPEVPPEVVGTSLFVINEPESVAVETSDLFLSLEVDEQEEIIERLNKFYRIAKRYELAKTGSGPEISEKDAKNQKLNFKKLQSWVTKHESVKETTEVSKIYTYLDKQGIDRDQFTVFLEDSGLSLFFPSNINYGNNGPDDGEELDLWDENILEEEGEYYSNQTSNSIEESNELPVNVEEAVPDMEVVAEIKPPRTPKAKMTLVEPQEKAAG